MNYWKFKLKEFICIQTIFIYKSVFYKHANKTLKKVYFNLRFFKLNFFYYTLVNHMWSRRYTIMHPHLSDHTCQTWLCVWSCTNTIKMLVKHNVINTCSDWLKSCSQIFNPSWPHRRSNMLVKCGCQTVFVKLDRLWPA